MSVNLFVGYYEDKNSKRNAELQECVQRNIQNPLINYVIIESQDRLKYNDFFRFINSYSAPDDINIIANLDIYLDEKTCPLFNCVRPKEIFALCRWERNRSGDIVFANRPDSQDVWAVKGHINGINGDFYMGWAGCDNRIAKVFADAGWKVSNPSKSIKTIHIHSSNIRNYKPGKRNKLVVPGPYLTIPPTTLDKK